MSYPYVLLGDYIDILSGFAFKSKYFSENGIPVIKIKNIVPPYVTLEDLSYVPNEIAKSNQKYLLTYNDVLIALTGSHINQMASVVGRIARVKYNIPSLLNQRVGKITVKNEGSCDINYVYYFLSQEQIKIALASKAGGAANQANISPSDIKKLIIPLPPIEIQRRIADILSAYDDLIENNRKQIKLLEEAAQRLYQEWFVDLRFPGHKHTKIMDGVPEGWRNIRLSDIAAINANNVPKDYPYDHIEYTDLSSVQNGIIKETTRYFLTEAPGRAKRMANDGDVIWGMVRPNLKSFALVLNPKETDVFSTGFCILSPKTVPFSYLYYAVTTESFVTYLVNCTNGAAYPAVKPIHFAEASLLCPDNGLLDRFNAIVEPMLRKREKLLIMINQAQQARDRLLPKLMSGVVKV